MPVDRFKTFLEIAAVFAVFFLFGAWKVPDVNEAHYIGKAIHYWNPDWIPGDPFLESRDAHWSFYMVFGWLSFFFSPTAMAWIGRCVAWGLLAWSWQRLSFALIPTRWVAIPTALALAYYIEAFNMAGEWLIGGIEGKSLAYPFVFFALESILRRRYSVCGDNKSDYRRWNCAGVFLGIACAFHVLVGGWATLIVGIIFFVSGDWRTVKFPWMGVLVGGLLALCGLVPVLMLNVGVSAATINEAHQIYVFQRLPHHLVPYLIKNSFVLRFALLMIIWIVLCRRTGNRRHQIFNGFVWGTLGIAAIGMILAYSLRGNQELSASILRFYWFRLSDIAVPMGVAMGSVGMMFKAADGRRQTAEVSLPKILGIITFIAAIYFASTYLCFGYFKMWLPDSTLHTSPLWVLRPDAAIPWAMTLLVCWGVFYFVHRARGVSQDRSDTSLAYAAGSVNVITLFYIAIALYAPLTVLPNYVNLRTYAGQCRTDPVRPNGKRSIDEWKDMCQWIQENTAREAKFWIPRDGHTFKWYAHRSDIGTWKNLPQDAESIVKWYRSMNELYKYKNEEGQNAEDRLLTTLLNSKTEEEIADLQKKYGFEYILCAQSYEMPKHSTLKRVYANDVYCLYRVME